MTELETLEHQLMADVAAAADEQAIEAVRVAALGKKGSVSELLKTLGAHVAGRAPDTRRGDQCAEDVGDRRDQCPQGAI